MGFWVFRFLGYWASLTYGAVTLPYMHVGYPYSKTLIRGFM